MSVKTDMGGGGGRVGYRWVGKYRFGNTLAWVGRRTHPSAVHVLVLTVHPWKKHPHCLLRGVCRMHVFHHGMLQMGELQDSELSDAYFYNFATWPAGTCVKRPRGLHGGLLCTDASTDALWCIRVATGIAQCFLCTETGELHRVSHTVDVDAGVIAACAWENELFVLKMGGHALMLAVFGVRGLPGLRRCLDLPRTVSRHCTDLQSAHGWLFVADAGNGCVRAFCPKTGASLFETGVCFWAFKVGTEFRQKHPVLRTAVVQCLGVLHVVHCAVGSMTLYAFAVREPEAHEDAHDPVCTLTLASSLLEVVAVDEIVLALTTDYNITAWNLGAVVREGKGQ